MKNWGKEFELVQVRKLPAADHQFWGNAGHHTYLTAEVAVRTEKYRQLPPWEQATARAAAVGLTADTAVVAGKSAARLLEISVLDWEPVVELMYADGKQAGSRPPGIKFRYSYLAESDVHTMHGIRLTGILRTLRDITCYHGILEGIVAIDSARRMWPALTKESLTNQLTTGPAYRGIGNVRQAIDSSVPNSGSALESKARWLLIIGEIPGVETIETQVRFHYDDQGGYFEVDILINGWLILEIDGAVKYDGSTYGRTDQVIRDERRREKELQNLGMVVTRVSNEHLQVRPDGRCGMYDLVENALANFTAPLLR